MTVYATERLIVREWTHDPADLDRMTDIYTRPEVLRWLPPFTFEAAPAVDGWHAFHERDRRFGSWAVEVRDTGVAAGTVLFRPIPGGDGEVEVGWHLHPDSWGNGYATEAARGAVERGFASGLEEVYALVKPDNDASMAVCRRLGMTPQGRTTRFFGMESEMFRLARDRRS
ncbi:GNAT family N-acetyltransferase [Streptosporangium sp. NPDC004379]|uniref:GNAT family N-acetyltransferase n=1 Tax=Streptosporangium sp. NPDC004379 TaxID=3366189 RepID=UPI0036B72A53